MLFYDSIDCCIYILVLHFYYNIGVQINVLEIPFIDGELVN